MSRRTPSRRDWSSESNKEVGVQKARTGDICFSGVWLALGLYIMCASYSLGLGDFQTPAAGFTPFFFGVIFSLFSIVNVIGHFTGKQEGNGEKSRTYSMGSYGHIGIMVGALLVYGILIERIGFLIMTCVVLTALFRVAGCNWKISLIWGPVVACGSYFAFSYLGVMLPAGIIGL